VSDLERYITGRSETSPTFRAYYAAYEHLASLGKLFREARERAGLSVATVAGQAQVDQGAVERWEAGFSVDLSFVAVFALAHLVGLEMQVAVSSREV